MKREPSRDSLISILLPLALIFGLVLLLSLNVGQTNGETSPSSPLESWLKLLVSYLAAGAEIAALCARFPDLKSDSFYRCGRLANPGQPSSGF